MRKPSPERLEGVLILSELNRTRKPSAPCRPKRSTSARTSRCGRYLPIDRCGNRSSSRWTPRFRVLIRPSRLRGHSPLSRLKSPPSIHLSPIDEPPVSLRSLRFRQYRASLHPECPGPIHRRTAPRRGPSSCQFHRLRIQAASRSEQRLPSRRSRVLIRSPQFQQLSPPSVPGVQAGDPFVADPRGADTPFGEVPSAPRVVAPGVPLADPLADGTEPRPVVRPVPPLEDPDVAAPEATPAVARLSSADPVVAAPAAFGTVPSGVPAGDPFVNDSRAAESPFRIEGSGTLTVLSSRPLTSRCWPRCVLNSMRSPSRM